MPPTATERATAPLPGTESGGRSTALAAIRASLEDGRTGCLMASDAGLGVIEVYVMSGEVLAAHAADDDVRLLARLAASGVIPPAQLESLAEACTAPGEFTEALYNTLDDEAVHELFYERFRENLYCFLGANGAIEFEPMEALFVANIQVGHDSLQLLEELASLRDRVAPLVSARLTLLPGRGTASGPDDARLVEMCANGLTVGELLRRATHESNRVLQSLSDLLDAGALVWDSAPASPAAPPAADAPAAPASAALGFALPDEDEHTDEGIARPPAGGAEPAASSVIEEEYLDAFGDYDTTRGDGSFSGVRDRVDLQAAVTEDALAVAAPPEILELPEADAAAHAGAVSLSFSGPRLADDDARSKLEVVNEVLEAVRAAIDFISGGGSGQARVQLIVDGSSGPFAALFNGVELRMDGRLPVDHVLKNLRKRPITEQRPLLQRASTDLIERALSMASEDLDEGLMEQVLEKVAGYQQRLGI